MATPLSRYAGTRNIADEDTRGDANSPYSFQEWSKRNYGTIADRENQQYEKYVREWYQSKEDEVSTATNIREDYIQLLKQISLTLGADEEELQLSGDDFEDDAQLKRAIPYYATKIKEIAQYFIFKREAVRRAKLKYNMINTNQALERLFYEYILKAFTKNKYANEYTAITDQTILSAVPNLSASQNMRIEIEEIYDDASYFDRDPTMPVSSYFINTSASSVFLSAKGFTDDDFEWLYNTGVSHLCADNPLLWVIDSVIQQYEDGIPLSAVENNVSFALNDYNRIKLAQKYMGEDQYIISGGYYTTPSGSLAFDIEAGNNWFYWPSGDNLFEISNLTPDSLALSTTNLISSNATAGTQLTAADIIFTQRNDEIKGAWLQLKDKETFSGVMSGRFYPGKTTFAYPFPGYGVSGEDLEWTGRSIDNIDRTFEFLEVSTQKAIWDLYWNTLSASVSTFDPVYLYDSTLAESGAIAASNMLSADMITVRTSIDDDSNNGVYSDQQAYAWLYKMEKTDIPVAVGTNTIYWPFQRVVDTLSIAATSTQCAPVYLSALNVGDFLGSVAGQAPSVSDTLYIKKSLKSSEYDEGAWLKGDILSQPPQITDTTLVSGTYQPNLSMRVLGGANGTFVWQDSAAPADNVFSHFSHQSDCDYLKRDQFSLFKEKPWQEKDVAYNQWRDCSCRAVLHTPLGHPGSSFDAYEGTADYIVAVSDTLSGFSFSDWRGHDGNDYTQSSEFGWYSLDNNYKVEPDVGWGSGDWVTNTGSQFVLSSNVMYMYFRNGMQRDNAATTVPYLVTKYKRDTPNANNQWMKLRYNKRTKAWEDAGSASDMIVRPGDILHYDHCLTYSITLTSQRYEFTIEERPVVPPFSAFAIRSDFSQNSQLPLLSTTWDTYGLSANFADPSNFAISSVSSLNFYPVSSIPLTFYSSPTGPVTLSATFENMNPATISTVLSTITTVVIDTYAYTTDAANFMLNVPLSGWNYTTNTYEASSSGARPFWAVAYDTDNDYTKNKGLNIWAGSPSVVDEYNFASQPPFSNILFREGYYVEYQRRGVADGPANTWAQPINGTVPLNNKYWRQLTFDRDSTSNLSAVMFNNIEELVISATEIDSDIVLDISNTGDPLQINYYARKAFTWNQTYLDSSQGLPPTGGVWQPILSGLLLLDADQPYAHLTNRHFPTYAMAPYIGDLYTAKEYGGFMVPHNLGASTALTQSDTNILETRGQYSSGNVYQDPSLYNTDVGLTNTAQYTPVSTIATDATWMKQSFINGVRRGMIKDADIYQGFVPYQTTFETWRRNSLGVLQQQDSDAQYKYITENLRGSALGNFETDIFGNQYGLYTAE